MSTPGRPENVGEVLIPGFHAVREALLRGRVALKEVWVAGGRLSPRLRELVELAAGMGVPVLEKPPAVFAGRFPDVAHQGVAAVAAPFAYADLEETARSALDRAEEALFVALDHVTDEGNLGALIRTSAFFGAQGMILPRDRSAGISPRVLKRASGACAVLPVVQVVNLVRSLQQLKAMGYWAVGTAGESSVSIYDFDWRRPTVLIMGNEEKGLSPGIRKSCDQLVAIPGSGLMESLNVSVAGGVVLAEIRRRHRTGKPFIPAEGMSRARRP